MVEERWSEAAEAYKRYCDLESDVRIVMPIFKCLNQLKVSNLYFNKLYHIAAAELLKFNIFLCLYVVILYFIAYGETSNQSFYCIGFWLL
jgi:hypothetical protein